MTNPDPADWWGRMNRFRADLREKGIHVGVSRQNEQPTCATCDELWPCSLAGKEP